MPDGQCGQGESIIGGAPSAGGRSQGARSDFGRLVRDRERAQGRSLRESGKPLFRLDLATEQSDDARMKWSHLRRVLCLLTAVILAAFAWYVHATHIPEPDPLNCEQLEAAAERWWQPDGKLRIIRPADWSPALRHLGPKDVFVNREGVYLRFGSFFVEDWGLFILPLGSPLQPKQGTDPSYRWQRGRVYKYEIKG